MPTALPLAAIRLDDACQPRAVTDLNLAGEYAEAMLLGAAFPPVVVFGDAGVGYWLADGYHRWHAATIAGLQTIAADVRAGGKREAILHSVGANAEHGWRRSTEDKQRAVMTLLNDPEWCQWSDREIGDRCGVSFRTVGKYRPASLGNLPSETRTYTNRHGGTSTMRTGGINADRRRDRAPAPEPDYPLREDPRQVDIEDAVAVYDRAAGDIRIRVSELVKQLAAANWPTPEEAHAAWMKGRGHSITPNDVQRAADWLSAFAVLFCEHEPGRLEKVDAMLRRAMEMTNGAH